MSDIVLGAIIGAAAATIGAVITGIINLKNSKLHIEASNKTERTNRLIEQRKGYLVPLRETLSKYAENSNQITNMTVRLKTAINHENVREFLETLESGKEFTSQLEKLRNSLTETAEKVPLFFRNRG